MDEYTAWADVPDHLKTKTQLGELGLKPAKGQKPIAKFCSYIRGRGRPNHYDLYDVNEAVPKRQPTPEQLANLEAAREKFNQLSRCSCGDYLSAEDYGDLKRRKSRLLDEAGQYTCRFCFVRQAASRWAREVLTDETALILDTETTGLDGDAEIVEISIITIHGEALLDTLVKPSRPIPPSVSVLHGITDDMVAIAPTWPEIDDTVLDLLTTASRVIVYNAEYDSRLVDQTRARVGVGR